MKCPDTCPNAWLAGDHNWTHTCTHPFESYQAVRTVRGFEVFCPVCVPDAAAVAAKEGRAHG